MSINTGMSMLGRNPIGDSGNSNDGGPGSCAGCHTIYNVQF